MKQMCIQLPFVGAELCDNPPLALPNVNTFVGGFCLEIGLLSGTELWKGPTLPLDLCNNPPRFLIIMTRERV